MQNDSVASRYANGLFQLAKEGNQIEFYKTQLNTVVLAFKDDLEIVKVLNHYRITDEDKFKIVDQVFGKELDPTLINFLKLILQKRRFNHFMKIIEEFNQLVNQSLGIKTGVVYSTTALSTQQLQSITSTLLNTHQIKAELKNLIDANLIGGYKIVIGDSVFDGSIRNQLDIMRQELSKGK
jgi:F-type H+-transporting ATPase subunit delta